MEVDMKKLMTHAAICANRNCPKFDEKAIMYLYPNSVYCSTRCKYTDTDASHNERYGD